MLESLKRNHGETFRSFYIYLDVCTETRLTVHKQLLHDIFHIGASISPRLLYQARQRSWRADIGRGLIPGTLWKIACHNLFITYLIYIDFYIAEKIFELTNCENKSLKELPLFNLQIFLFRVRFEKDIKQYRSVQ